MLLSGPLFLLDFYFSSFIGSPIFGLTREKKGGRTQKEKEKEEKKKERRKKEKKRKTGPRNKRKDSITG